MATAEATKNFTKMPPIDDLPWGKAPVNVDDSIILHNFATVWVRFWDDEEGR